MIAYIIRRILYALPIALGVAVIIFSLVHIAPGDPLSALVPADAPSSVVERLRQDYGMDRPLPAQFALWLGRVLQGDLGISIATRRPVAGELSVAVVNTLILAVCASLIGFPLGRSEEHTSELQSLMRISYAVFCLKKKKIHN